VSEYCLALNELFSAISLWEQATYKMMIMMSTLY